MVKYSCNNHLRLYIENTQVLADSWQDIILIS